MRDKVTAMKTVRSILVMLTVIALAMVLAACNDDDDNATQAQEPGGSLTRTDVVQTEYGPTKGFIDDGVRKFLGLRYAAPPVGNLRWRPPQPPDEWQEVRDAVEFGNKCPQTSTGAFYGAKSSTEDCLYLNVFTPTGAGEGSGLPVMVWIHGGGLTGGASNPYDGSSLVKKGNVVVVTINYRLNIFGFLAMPALDNEGHDVANYGLRDQQFALKWVQDNIAKFGGDPNNITIFGESSGGTSVIAQMASPTATGLFQRAIIQSGDYYTTGLEAAKTKGQAFVQAVGCQSDDASQVTSCLRSLSAEEIQATGRRYWVSGPIVGDRVLPESLVATFKSGRFNKVPVINGTNLDEGTFFVGATDAQGYRNVLKNGALHVKPRGPSAFAITSGFGAKTIQVLNKYPLSDYDSPSLAVAAVVTDSLMVCPALRLNQLFKQNGVTVYYYQFADRTAPQYAPPKPFPAGAYHTAEIQYLFLGYHGAAGTKHPLNPAQEQLADAMISYWTTFAKSGNPNSSATPYWPNVTSGQYQSLQLPLPVTKNIVQLRQQHHCDFWDNLQTSP